MKDINEATKNGKGFSGRGEPPRAPDVRRVALSKLKLEERCQCRAGSDEDAIAEYAAAYLAKVELPPLDGFEVAGEIVVVDGFHRFAAALRARLAFLMVRIVGRGSLDDAVLRAIGANRSHGLRRSNADKRRAVQVALAHPALKGQSNRALAEVVGVDEKTVAAVRGAPFGTSPPAVNPAAPTSSRVVSSTRPEIPDASDQPRETIEAGSERRQDTSGRWQPAAKPAKAPNGHAAPLAEPPEGAKAMPSAVPWEKAAQIVRAARLQLGELQRDYRDQIPQAFDALVRDLQTVEVGFSQATPTPCPSCEGEGCFLCRSKGWVQRGAADSQQKAAERRR